MKREGGGVSQRHQNLCHQQEAYLPLNSRFFHAVFLFIPDVNGINAIIWVPSIAHTIICQKYSSFYCLAVDFFHFYLKLSIFL